MAKRQNSHAAAWVVSVVVTLILGCSSNDNSGTNPYIKLTGDPNDPIYQNIRDEIGFSTVYSQGILKDVFDMLPQIAPEVFPVAGTMRSSGIGKTVSHAAEYDSVTRYWVRSYTDTAGLSDTSLTTYVDSVQFIQGNTAVQFPDSLLLTSLRISSRHSLAYTLKADSVAYSLQATLSGQAGALANGGDIIITGSGLYLGFVTDQGAAGSDTACDRTFAYTLRLEDLRANISRVFYGQGCPTGGLIRHTGMLIAACSADSLNYEKQWTGIATFTGQLIKFTIENPTTRWVYQTTCDAIAAPPTAAEALPPF